MRQLSAFTKTAYGLGALADGVKTTAFGIFLLFYYNQVLGLSAFWGGVALGAATVIDAISDPFMGAYSDDFKHRWGRRHPFLYWSVIPLAVTFVLLFAPPPGLSEWALFAWLLSFTVLLRLAMSLYSVPHMALGAELSSDYHERTTIVGYRNFMSFVGAVFVIAVGWGVFFRSTPQFVDGQLNPAGYPGFGVACAIAAALSVLLSALGTHSRIPHLPRSDHHDEFSLRRLVADQRAALANASFRALFFGVVLFFVTRGIEQVLGLYVLTHFWQVSSSAIGLVQAIAMAGVLIGTVVWIAAFSGVEKKPAFLLGISLFSLFSLMPPLAKMIDWWPANDSPYYIPLLAAVGFIAALGAAVSLITSGSMMADIADEHELESGRRQEGIFFGGLIFAVKATSGLGQFIAGGALALIDFPANAQPGTVPEDIVHRLAFLYGPGLSVIAIVAIIIMSRYRIDRARHSEIAAALAARRPSALPD
jgi:GPH family glycoside/pentoside/hexuronide:cation symporter